MTGLWEPLAALAAIVLPLLLAWWLVVRGAKTRHPGKHRARDNAAHRRDAP